jgi:hypothetical protein
MCIFYIPWICCRVATFFQRVSLIELNAWEDEWFVAIKKNNKKNDQKKGRRKKIDLICDQYINACKLGANWEHQFFYKKPCKFITIIIIIIFFHFYVVETFSKSSSLI